MRPFAPFLIAEDETTYENYRIETFWDKEPETLSWIDALPDDGCLIDVGANIGLYSIYAGRRLRVIAVEPMVENYIKLSKNIWWNRLFSIDVLPVCVACGDKDGWWDVGAPIGIIESGESFSLVPSGVPTTVHRPIQMVTLDHLIREFCIPYDKIGIKIDVDGSECQVLRGLSCFSRVHSILVEAELSHIKWVYHYMKAHGFKPWAEMNARRPHSITRRRAENIPVRNLIFRREYVAL